MTIAINEAGMHTTADLGLRVQDFYRATIIHAQSTAMKVNRHSHFTARRYSGAVYAVAILFLCPSQL